MAIHLIVNSAAAGGAAAGRVEEALAGLRSRGSHVELYTPESADAALRTMKNLARGGAERVVVLGGDGTAHVAANALVGTKTVLGILPAGTGNDSVTGLGLPSELRPACRAALGDPTAIDLIESDGRYALTVATLGFSVAVNLRANQMRFPRGGSRYTMATLRELPRLALHTLTLTLDGDEHEIEAQLVAVGNTSHFGGGMDVVPAADPTDAKLDVVVVRSPGKATFATLLPTVFSGQHVKSKYVTEYRAERVEVSGPDLDVSADGEPFGSLPITLTVRPKSLLVAGVS